MRLISRWPGSRAEVTSTLGKGTNMRRSALGGVGLSPALVLAACGGDDAKSSPGDKTGAPKAGEKVELTWWHNATEDPLKSYFQQAAAAFTAKNPNVTFKIEPIQNE